MMVATTSGGGLIFSYPIRTNVSVRRGVIWGISVHNIHKGDIFQLCSVYIKKAITYIEV